MQCLHNGHATQRKVQKYIPTDADYEKAEIDLLRDALKRTYTERFLMATRLYKIAQTMKKATFTNPDGTTKKWHGYF